MTKLSSTLRFCLSAGLAIDLVLIGFGKLIAPSISLVSLVAPIAMILVYALLTLFGPPFMDRVHPRILRWALLFGLIAGAVFAGEIVLEYILLPADNTPYGYVEFGIVFCIYFLSALVTVAASKSLRQAVLTALATAVIASLIWDLAVLLTFYAFRGMPQQALVFGAEGNYQDFARSGVHDFTTFIVEDFMGATFFHLLLGPVLAVVLGALGGLLGKLITRFSKNQRNKPA